MQTNSFCRSLFDYLRNGFVPSKTVLFISGLVFSHALVQKAVVDVLIDFLTEDLCLGLTRAIVLTNMLSFISAVLKVVVTHISEGYTGAFIVIIFCTAAYTMGVMLLWFRTGLILATVLIALGKAGEEPSLRDFFYHQLSEKVRKKYSQENNRNGTSNNLWSTTASFTGTCMAIFWLDKSEVEWREKFKVSSLVMGSTYFLFFFGIFCYYPEVRSIGSPLTAIYRVFMAAIQKRGLPYPSLKEGYYSDDNNTHQGSNELEERPTNSTLITTISRVFEAAIQKSRILPYLSPKESYSSNSSDNLEDPFYRKENGDVHLLPRDASFLLFLDKAAIIRSNKFDTQGHKGRDDNVCTAEQVRDVKSLYPLIPLGIFVFFAYSLIFASGDTYFVMQAQNLNPKVGDFHVSVLLFFVLQSLVAFAVRTIQPIRKLVKPTWSIGIGMFCSVLCCIAAALVELRRLKLIKPAFKEDPSHIIPLSIMVLTAQYFLLGLMQGCAEYGLGAFLCIGVPKSMMKFVEPCVEMLWGLGNLCSALFVLIFHSWIKDSINDSHLDKYFFMLASVSFVSFGIYVCCAKFKLLKLLQFDEPSLPSQGNIGRMTGVQLEVLAHYISS
ncbi:protein NRT1/ PTR FAMILY 5.7-like [Neltuma alba]|uniref:protein NRT1/ PTR FAMILY 5.7-like n=1 Tax=Neltuma alba TaxID=207710 RepID=UPI0010A42DA1|nr:protein NRT1/ PTR FAMILY 5.7-like [Prosopis alba]